MRRHYEVQLCRIGGIAGLDLQPLRGAHASQKGCCLRGRQLFCRAFLIKMPNNWPQTLQVTSWNLFWLQGPTYSFYTLLLMDAPCQATRGRAD